MTKTTVDFSHFLGRWQNTYKATRGISSFEISSNDGIPQIRVFGSEKSHAPGDWGEVQFTPLGSAQDHKKAAAFQVNYEINGVNSWLAVNANKGILIIAAYHSFPNSDLSYFSREFFFHN